MSQFQTMQSNPEQDKSKQTKAKSIASPCVDICALDDNDICIGCFRHGNEISQWGKYSDEEKLEVLKRTHLRSQGYTGV